MPRKNIMGRMARRLLRWINLYPPFLGAGIRIIHMSEDMLEIDTELKLRWWNRNYVGTQYGGSLYSMTDPFYMLMLMKNLGSGYIVWDKAATIRFKKPGRGAVRAEFRLTQQQVDDLRTQLATQEKIEPTFTVAIRDLQGETIAEVDKLVYIRRKTEAAEKP
jgi:hypothetical protein